MPSPAVLMATLPWLALIAFLAVRVRLVPELPRVDPGGSGGSVAPRLHATGEAPVPPAPSGTPLSASAPQFPRVTVIVPARNEALNIGPCVASLTRSRYPDFDVLVVDDRSTDDTAVRAAAVPPGNARSVTVVDGRDLPEGWLGKPWACWQGAERAEGDVLLFTDADTVHEPDLLERAVAGLHATHADLLTVSGRQVMGSFWERLVQPQVFFTMILRFHDVEASVRRGKWRDAIANGQFMMFPAESYHELRGHRAVRDEVAEDLALAQRVMRDGKRLVVRRAEDDFATRMYRGLGDLVAGWSKNVVMGGSMTVTPRLRPFMAPASFLAGVGLWLVPPVVLILGVAGWVSGAVTTWAALVVGLSMALWALVTHRMEAPAWYGLLYPLGAAVGSWIFLRSWIRGRDVEWKGRSYRLKSVAGSP